MVYLFSFLGAISYALASVLQQLAAGEAPPEQNMGLNFMVYLFKRKIWVAGILFDGLGYVMQAVALNFGPLALVEPLFVTGLLFALPLGAAVKHRMLNKLEWVGAVAVTAGLATFVVATQPGKGDYDIAPGYWIAFGAIALLSAVFAWAVGRTGQGTRQAVAIGLSCGVAFAFGTALTKYLTGVFSDGGISSVITNPALYVLVVDGAVAMLMSQSAFHAGPLQASLPALTVSEPVLSSLVGVWLFHEHIHSGAEIVVIAVTSAVVIAAGIIVLAREDDRGTLPTTAAHAH